MQACQALPCSVTLQINPSPQSFDHYLLKWTKRSNISLNPGSLLRSWSWQTPAYIFFTQNMFCLQNGRRLSNGQRPTVWASDKKKKPNPTQITLSQVSQCAVTHKGDFSNNTGDFNYGNEKTENNVVALQLFKYTIFKASQSIWMPRLELHSDDSWRETQCNTCLSPSPWAFLREKPSVWWREGEGMAVYLKALLSSAIAEVKAHSF